MRPAVVVLAALLVPQTIHAQQVQRWTVTRDLRIGSVDDERYTLTAVGTVVVGPDGHVYVSQSQDNNIRVFDAAGRVVRTIGRKGAGPGEFEGLSSIGFLADTLYASDFRHRRVTFFKPDGTVISSKLWTSPQMGQFSPTTPFLLLRDGSGIVAPAVPSAAIASGEVTAIPYLRIDRAGALMDTVAMRSHQTSQLAFQRGTGGLYTSQPFSDDPIVTIAHDGSQVAVVERKSAERSGRAEFRVTRTRIGGAAMYARAYAYEPVAIPRAHVDSLLGARAKELAQFFGNNAREAESQLRSKMYLPRFFAPVTSAQFSEDGYLWLRRTSRAGQPQVWEVHNPAGEAIATVSLPEKARLLRIQANTIWTSETDDLDVPYVVRYRLQRSAAR